MPVGLSTGNEIGLGLFALAWIVVSLVVSIVIPRSRPDFPGKNLGAFVALMAVFFVAMLFAVAYFGREPSEGEAATETTVATQTTAETTTAGTTTAGETTTEAETTTGETTGAADLAAGKAAFEKASCGGCHTLKDANASGKVGPDLDQTQPSMDRVETQVTNGGGGMPPFKGVLSPEEIQAVAAYVSQVAGQS